MKGNKTFVTSMIITSVIALTALLIVMFIGIKYFVKETSAPEQEQLINANQTDQEFYITSMGTVREINEEQIIFLNLQKKEVITHKIKPTTKILDAYENTIPLESIKKGDLVDIVYQPEKDNLVCIRFTANSFAKQDMKNLKIDRSNRTISIGNKSYYYTGNTMVLDEEGNLIDMHKVNDYDVLELIGMGENIYTVKVLEREGYLHIGQLPAYEGVLEIDLNRQIPLKEDMKAIAITPGEHKVTLSVAGYEPVVTRLVIEPGKTTEYTLESIERSQTELVIQVNNAQDYKVKVEDVLYAKDERIKVPTGKYTIEVIAEGYKKWQQEVNLQDPVMLLQVTLASIEEETNGEEAQVEKVPSSNNNSSGLDYSINISSEPSDAKVYINGEHKGSSPYKTKLPVGEHTITLKKEGYKDYETNILIDHSDDQNSYLYTLIPE